ncbi:MAG: sulfite reductase subunit alpha [Pseudomonadota bacterium]
MMTIDPVRWGAALALLGANAGLCLALLRAKDVAAEGAVEWLVAFASQTGTGEYLARQTVATLRTGGLSARAASLDTLGLAALRGVDRILFIVSTYGEGDAPDSAARFCALLDSNPMLGTLHYGLLALGDSTYANFCGFGRTLDAALQAGGAQALFERIEVDRGAAVALEAWRHRLSHLAGTSDAPDWNAPAYGNWRIAARRLMNPGSAGAPVHEVSLVPADGALPAWEAGDLVQVSAPGDPDRPREYSIASVGAEGLVTLLVRLHLQPDGGCGQASGWLCLDAKPDDTVALRLRQHSRFRQGANGARPLVLIGNGTGIAGLRAHLRQRIDDGEHRNWLLFGERNAAHDYFWRGQMEAWHRDGALAALDLAFSRDAGAPKYVQHALTAQAERLRAWVADGAAIYVCGSLQGMAAGVHEALVAVLGAQCVEQLGSDGRYRRDVY